MLNENINLEPVPSKAIEVYPLRERLHHEQPRTLHGAAQLCKQAVYNNELTVFVVSGKTRINGGRSELFLFSTTQNGESGCSVNPIVCVSRQWKDRNGCQGDCECLRQALVREVGSFVMATRQTVTVNGSKVSGVCFSTPFENHIDAVKVADQPYLFEQDIDLESLQLTT